MMDSPRLAREGQRHVFLRDMVLPASIGVYPHERTALQRIRLNLDLGVSEGGVAESPLADQAKVGMSRPRVGHDELGRVVDYEKLAEGVRAVVRAGHVMLVETLAERIAEMCLDDPRVHVARVRVEKLDVFADMVSAGVEIERRRMTCPPGPIDSQ